MKLRAWFSLPRRSRQLLVRAVAVVAVVRVALFTLPFPLVRRLVRRVGRRAGRAADPLSPAAIDGRAQLVEIAARYVPAATCLTQALALQAMLGRAGTPSELRIGVARGAEAGLDAHAWLECDGRVVIGGGQLERYAAMPGFGEFAG